MGYNVIVAIAPCEYFHWFPYKSLAVIIECCSRKPTVWTALIVRSHGAIATSPNLRFLDSGCAHLQIVTFCELMVHSHLRFVTRLRFISIGWIGISNVITKTGAQSILEPNGNRKRNDNRITRMHSSRDAYRPLVDRMLQSASLGVLHGPGGVSLVPGVLHGRGVSLVPGGSPWSGGSPFQGVSLVMGGSSWSQGGFSLAGGLPGPGGLPCPGWGLPGSGESPCEQNDRHV